MALHSLLRTFFILLVAASAATGMKPSSRERVASRALASSHCIQHNKQNGHDVPRFVQSKSKFNFLLFLTNLLFGGQTKYKPQFQTGGCPGWYLNPMYGPAPIGQDFLQTSGWSYDVPNGVVQYSGSSEDREPTHPFPFFWLYRRTWTKSTLIKRNFFCQNTRISADIQLNGAEEAGLTFRIIGDWNFWGILLTKSGQAQMVRVYKGEKKVLKTVPGVKIQPGKWYTVQLQEMIGDVKVSVGEYGGVLQNVTRSLEDIDEIDDEDQGAVGLLASKGAVKFRNTQIGDVEWMPQDGGPGAIDANSNKEGESAGDVALDFGNIENLKEKLSGWCPKGAICAGKPYDFTYSK